MAKEIVEKADKELKKLGKDAKEGIKKVGKDIDNGAKKLAEETEKEIKKIRKQTRWLLVKTCVTLLCLIQFVQIKAILIIIMI